MNHFVYKYVHNGVVIYVGLTDNIIRRVAEHASGQGLEAKFLPYLDSEIYYHRCGNEVEMRALESLLINQYKPILNIVDCQPGDSTVNIDIDWECYLPALGMANFEVDLARIRKNMMSNKTRIEGYQNEIARHQNVISSYRPFYIFLQQHSGELMVNPDAVLHIPNAVIPRGDALQIGLKTSPVWYETLEDKGDYTDATLSADTLQAFFQMAHKSDWVETTLGYIGGNSIRDLTAKIQNLRRRNAELESQERALLAQMNL